MLQDVPTMLGGRYRVVERLGRGGMADVYQAEDVVLRRAVAIKIFRGGVEREQHLARFRTEVRTLAALTHPHLVALYDAGGDVAEPWCAMEYVDGGSLADREGALPPAQVARIGEQIASGLAYVHERGIVHRDVKPSNVLLDSGGDAFLSDFGIAKLVDGTRMTQSGLMIGTAAFLSPEQVRGRPAVPTSDVYALGLVLLEALTGRREYPGTPVESAVARLSRPPEVPEEFGVDVGDLLRSMTAEAAEDRPTPAEVAVRLRAAARRLSVMVRPAPGSDVLVLPDPPAEGAEGATPDAPDVAAPDPVAPDPVAPDPVAPDPVAPDPARPPTPASVTPRVPVLPLPRPEAAPRNLLGWLSPECRRQVAALLAGVGVVVAVALALPLVDGRRVVDGAVRVDGTSSAGDALSSATASPTIGEDTQLLRKAPVGLPPATSEEQRRRTTPQPVRIVAQPRAIAEAATTRAPSTPTPTRSVSPSPSTSSPSTSGSASPSSPSPSGSTSASPTSLPTTPTPTVTSGETASGGPGDPSTATPTVSLGPDTGGIGTGGSTGVGTAPFTDGSGPDIGFTSLTGTDLAVTDPGST